MKNILKRLYLCGLILSMLIGVCGCSTARSIGVIPDTTPMPTAAAFYLDESAPIIEFEPLTKSEDGLPEYYLFDDNPEHLNSKFLADGEEPSSIAHFENLTPGIYTVFSYHHRGYSVDFNTDLYYDAVFSSNNNGEFEILNLGLDHDWNWNQAWADYTDTEVIMPEYLRTFNCNCGSQCPCLNGGECEKSDCPAIIRDESRQPKTSEYDNLNTPKQITKDAPIYLSEFVSYIQNNDVNHFRYGGWNEPMWMMLRFKILSGNVTFDTIAYQNKEQSKINFTGLKKGAFDNEPQYKGIAKNAPIVTSKFDYEIDDNTVSGAVPVTVKNARVPQGATITDGIFATNVNTWREPLPIAAESDIMLLEYKDDSKLELYGDNMTIRDNIWRFDPYHTKHYGGYDENSEQALQSFGVPIGSGFAPNISILDINYPKGEEISTNDFYKYNACNLGNFGVTVRYIIHLKNSGTQSRKFSFTLKSIAGQVYRYSQTDTENGQTITDDGGKYIMKKFDDDPREDPASTSDPKERLTPAEMGDTLTFDTMPGKEYEINIEVTTLTGCVAPMHNIFEVK